MKTNEWYFKVESVEYGSERFGPYDTEDEAWQGLKRVVERSAQLNDGVEREFTVPYPKEDK